MINKCRANRALERPGGHPDEGDRKLASCQRRALHLADERAKEANGLRDQLAAHAAVTAPAA